jgi:predicted  nucleic acid-binding Zn-ribbon protein
LGWNKERYKIDPTYRIACLNSSKATQAKNMLNPVYRKLRYARTRIWVLRDSIDRHMIRIAKVEKELLMMLRRKEKLEKQFKDIKKSRKEERKESSKVST